MVKKIRVLDEAVAEDTKDEASMENFYELAKTMDWKLWEILQIMQRLEKKLGKIKVDS
tara:strand:+ start:1240 stop:1413 length:174 start_codon:yes stop_codon:yes gene_type:complete